MKKWVQGGLVLSVVAILAACHARGAAPPMTPDTASASSTDAGEETHASTEHDAGSDAATESLESLPAAASDKPAAEAPAAAVLQGNEEGARALLMQFVAPNADHLALTSSLRPTSNDYHAMFDAKSAAKIEAGQAKEWNSHKAVIKPKAGQTEVKLWSATGAELAKGSGNAKEFPAEYKKVGKHLQASVTFYRFKFVEPGKDTGTAYDGLSFVNGHWVIAPKPWRALEGKSTHADDEDKPAASPKPKGQGKGGKGKGKKR